MLKQQNMTIKQTQAYEDYRKNFTVSYRQGEKTGLALIDNRATLQKQIDKDIADYLSTGHEITTLPAYLFTPKQMIRINEWLVALGSEAQLLSPEVLQCEF